MSKKAVEEFVRKNQDEAVELLQTLGRIPSPSHHEEKRAEFIKAWFEDNGLGEVWIDGAKNVLCKLKCDTYEDITVFAAHTDIVFPDTEPLMMKRDGNILRAPGIGDDTANLVHLMLGARYLSENRDQLKTGVMIVANSCEEGLGNLDGTKELFNCYGDRIKRFYSFDGYLSQCTSVPVGSHRYRIKVFAEGGHSYLNFGNPNAIKYAADLIEELYKVTPPQEAYTTYNVGTIEGGTTVNSIAQETVLLYEYRSSSEHCLSVMKKTLEDIVHSFRAKGIRIEVEILGIRPGLGPVDKAALRAWTDSNIKLIKEFYDGEIDEGPYSTDSNIPLSLGIFGNTIGTIAGAKAHTREEWVDLASVPTGMKIVTALMDTLLS